MASTIEIIGLERGKALFDAAHVGQRFGLGMLRAGQEVAGEMARSAKEHHDTGRLEQQIHATAMGEGFATEVHVGISTGLAPEGRPLAFGWKSGSGKQPPVQAIAEWLSRHPSAAAGLANARGQALVSRNGAGFVRRAGTIAEVTGDAALRSRAFLIARAIGRRGYRFGKHDWFHTGIDRARPRLEGILRRSMRGEGGS